MTFMYRRAHHCDNIASRAHESVMTKLKNQRELTHMAEFDGEKVGGLNRVGGVGTRVPLGSARS